MAIYRFRVSFEDYDEIIREIDVLSKHTFLDLHFAIQKALGYDPEKPSSFFISNDQWKKGEEFTYLPSDQKIKKGALLMENTRLNKHIDDPHQKFYYTYNFERPFDFHVQLIKILKEEEGKEYPSLFKSIGKSPKPFNNTTLTDDTIGEEEPKNEFDFLNDLGYDNADEEDFDMMDDDAPSDEFPEEPTSDNEY